MITASYAMLTGRSTNKGKIGKNKKNIDVLHLISKMETHTSSIMRIITNDYA
jgi:hypothetical protein